MQTKTFEAEVKQVGERVLEFTISTGAVDRDKDTVAPSGWKLDAYRRNPVVLWAHNYQQPPIGKATKVWVAGNALKAQAEFATAEVYPFADTIFQLLKGGFLRAVSVGFEPVKHAYNAQRGGVDYTEQALLEFSIVPVPANAEALMRAAAKGIDVRPVLAYRGGEDSIEIEGLTITVREFGQMVGGALREAMRGDVFEVEPEDIRTAFREVFAGLRTDLTGRLPK
jgi:uncharacterized protein